MKTFSHLWQYLADILLKREMFQIKIVKKIKTPIICCDFFFLKIVLFMRYCRKMW
jgi:hypothetical protein